MGNYLITGATSGIGEACARNLAGENNVLILVGRNEEKLQSLQQELPGEILSVCYDLTDLANIKSIYTDCGKKKIKLDGLVYSAGMDGTWPIKVNSIEQMQKMMSVNCFAFVELAKFFYSKRYSNDGAAIVAVSSIASLTSEVGMVAYSASKAALNSVVKTMSKEFIRRKIRVNAVLPGGVSTPMAEQKGELLSTLDASQSSTSTVHGAEINPQPLGALPKEYVAEQIVYLLSDNARYMTGECMVISGGRTY